MGDNVKIQQIQYLRVQDIYQIDLYNETKKEYYRVFADREQLHLMLDIAGGGRSMTNKRYLFRGFHPDENGKTTITLNGEKRRGEWMYWNVFGRLTEPVSTTTSIFITLCVFDLRVIPETIGQWVTTDKNGKDVFEGDMVKWSPELGKVCRGIVDYLEDSCCYVVSHNDYSARCDYIDDNEYELIGNEWEVTE